VVEYFHKLQSAGVSTESKGSFLGKMSVKVAKYVSLLKKIGEYALIDYLKEVEQSNSTREPTLSPNDSIKGEREWNGS
jgi:hypothetical protein